MPISLEYVPPAQLTHAAWAGAGWEVPTAHRVQFFDPGSGCTAPVEHSAHELAPSSAEYFPLSHKLHAAARVAENDPLRHVSQTSERPAENVPGGHSLHEVAPLAWFTLAPDGHVTQSPVVASGAYLPKEQVWQLTVVSLTNCPGSHLRDAERHT